MLLKGMIALYLELYNQTFQNKDMQLITSECFVTQ